MKNIRYYAIGHSYLRHGPFQGWQTDGFWGMAASEPSKDYFHTLQSLLTEKLGVRVEAIAENHASFERACTTSATRDDYLCSDSYKQMERVIREFKPNLITTLIGDGNTVARDEKSLTLFFEMLCGLIKKEKRDETVVVCACMNGAFEYARPIVQKYGFKAVDCRFIHSISGRDNPYYAFNDYPEYDNMAADGAVEFRTHPNDAGHKKIAEALFEGAADGLENIPDGDFSEPYSYECFSLPEYAEKFNIRVSPELPIRFDGFNLRNCEDGVIFSSAPGTGASVASCSVHLKPVYKRLTVEMSVCEVTRPTPLELIIHASDGTHTYSVDMTDSKMRKYEFDISDLRANIRIFRISPAMEECLVTVKSIELTETP